MPSTQKPDQKPTEDHNNNEIKLKHIIEICEQFECLLSFEGDSPVEQDMIRKSSRRARDAEEDEPLDDQDRNRNFSRTYVDDKEQERQNKPNGRRVPVFGDMCRMMLGVVSQLLGDELDNFMEESDEALVQAFRRLYILQTRLREALERTQSQRNEGCYEPPRWRWVGWTAVPIEDMGHAS